MLSKNPTPQSTLRQQTIILVPKKKGIHSHNSDLEIDSNLSMSRIAQKLCEEIVEPALKPTKASTFTRKSSSRLLSPSPLKSNGKIRSIIIEKRKVVNKLVSNGSNASRAKGKSKESLSKKIKDSGVNTLITGQLRCDNDCVTMVRKRDYKCTCKYGQKRSSTNVSSKQLQTFDTRNLPLTDKACAQWIETANCGTQLNKYSGILKRQSVNGTNQPTKDKMEANSNKIESYRFDQASTSIKPCLDFMGARRWAVSKYNTRGPDF